MRLMKDQHVARLEAQLERLVEGAFASLFGKRIRAQDIALQLARAMHDGVRTTQTNDLRPLAPDQYIIYLNPNAQSSLLQNFPGLIEILGQHIVALATHFGYRLSNAPLVRILADAALNTNELNVKASHTNRPENSTALMPRVTLPFELDSPRNPQLLVNGEWSIQLDKKIIKIGRDRDNHIIIDDRFVSRHHIQLQLRSGNYTLFDIQTQGGTFVNDVSVKEHRLQPGDVIRIGHTRLVYVEDDPVSDSPTGQSEPVDLSD
jgi:pSer/pThr/pTyr-binding forkhead associated (FHA) protein